MNAEIERLARAAAALDQSDEGVAADWQDYLGLVRAILQALIPPSEGMVEAGEELFPCTRGTESRAGQATPEAIFEAMIQHILGEHP